MSNILVYIMKYLKLWWKRVIKLNPLLPPISRGQRPHWSVSLLHKRGDEAPRLTEASSLNYRETLEMREVPPAQLVKSIRLQASSPFSGGSSLQTTNNQSQKSDTEVLSGWLFTCIIDKCLFKPY